MKNSRMRSVHYKVPFVSNPDNRCVPATIAMVVQYFMPEKHFTLAQSEHLCGYVKGMATWEFAHMLKLDELGFEQRRIDDFDLKEFAADPEKYLRKILKDPAALEYQLANAGDLQLHGAEAREYLKRGLHHEQRPGTLKDVKQFLDDGWLVRLEVNARPLVGTSGYDGHSVLVIGYDDKGFILHNPDGVAGDRPNQHISPELLTRAWREFGGSFSLYAFRKGM